MALKEATGVCRRLRGAAWETVLVLVFAVGLLNGCVDFTEREEKRVATQELQLQKHIELLDKWGAEILEQVPVEDTVEVYPSFGNAGPASDGYEAWPKLYVWRQGVELRPDEARTPTALATELEPWLESQGWKRAGGDERFPREDRRRFDYMRGPYHLIVEAHTVEPPMAQSLNFSIVSPATDPEDG